MARLEEVKTWSQVRRFLELPGRLHSSPDTLWVAPPRFYERIVMGRLYSPERRFWLVRSGEQAVARMGAVVYDDKVHFGFFECFEGYPEAARLMMEAAQSLAPGFPIQGPYHFDIEEPYTGVLTQGFEYEPTFLMPYNPPYYDHYLGLTGLEPMADLYSYLFLPDRVRLDRMRGRAEKAAAAGVTVHPMPFLAQAATMKTCVEIANQAWADNWGFEELGEEQLQTLIWFCRVFFDSRGTILARYQGKDIGFAWILRNFNHILKPARGRLTLRLLWDFLFKSKDLKSFRGHALGVLPEHRKLNVPAALVHYVMAHGDRVPWTDFEIGWIQASNTRMNAMARALGGIHHKTHRLYQRAN